ncbi:MAG: response regulator [Planctomycetota bacterium]|nr:response regulator [Planctomycetota bacterium]MDW8372479.1 response regulator [Planctomycetota bacterium]
MSSAVRRTHTVLVADDDEQIRILVWEILAEEGWRVLPARHGQEALQLLARFGDSVDVVLADVVMPRLGGKDLAQRIARDYPHIRVVFFSGYGDSPELGSEFPDAEVLDKPFTAEQLLAAVSAASRKRRRNE